MLNMLQHMIDAIDFAFTTEQYEYIYTATPAPVITAGTPTHRIHCRTPTSFTFTLL